MVKKNHKNVQNVEENLHCKMILLHTNEFTLDKSHTNVQNVERDLVGIVLFLNNNSFTSDKNNMNADYAEQPCVTHEALVNIRASSDLEKPFPIIVHEPIPKF